MRVVLDTNVIIAAFAARGLCHEIFEICLEDHDIIMSEHILDEVKKNLIKKVHLSKDIVRNIIGYLMDSVELVETKALDESACRDKSDDKIIGAALKGNATFIMTGDDDLLTLKSYGEIEIITPREFWNILKQGTR